MASSEWSELLRVLDASAHEREPDASLLALLMESFGVGERVDALLPRVPVSDQGDMVPERRGVAASGATQVPLGGLLRASSGTPQVDAVAAPAPGPVVSSGSSGGGVEGVLKTIGTVTGVGPLAAGLLKLFGRGSDGATEAVPALPFSLPDQISVEAGLAADRSFVPVAYSQRGVSRSVAAQQGSSAMPAQVLVNVQAMDSRSFLDHSDDIARAVRDAMLRSHALNDVVAEI